jgi:acetyl esterase
MSRPFVQRDTQELLDVIAAAQRPKLDEVTLDEARAMFRHMATQFDLPAPKLHKIRDARAGDVPARIYFPAVAATGPVIAYFHGGGWVIGDLDTHESFCAALALRTGLRVVAVDYRLAPEHRYPAAHDDCRAAFAWIAGNPAELEAPVTGIGVAGDSAGGNLAAAVALGAATGDARPLAQLLLYPVTDCAAQSSSYAAFAEGFLLERATMEWFIGAYLPDAASRRAPDVSLLGATSFTGFPPTVIVTCELDPLRDEGRAFAARLIEAGVTVKFSEAPGQIHGIATSRAALPSAALVLDACIDDFSALLRAG